MGKLVNIDFSGHASNSGIQRHSVGEFMPHIIYRQESPTGLRTGVIVDGKTDAGTFATYEEAERFVRGLQNLDDQIHFLERLNGHGA